MLLKATFRLYGLRAASPMATVRRLRIRDSRGHKRATAAFRTQSTWPTVVRLRVAMGCPVPRSDSRHARYRVGG